MDDTALGELSPGLSHTAPKAHQGAQAGAETGQASVCPCLVEKKIIKLFLSLIVLRLHFSCSLETQLEKSAHLQAPRKAQNMMSVPQKGVLFPSKFPRAQMPRVAFPHSHWTKDYFNFSVLWQIRKGKGESRGERAPACPISRVHQQLCQQQHPAGSQHCNASSWGCASPRSLLEHQRFHQLGQKGGEFWGWAGTGRHLGGFRVIVGNKQLPATAGRTRHPCKGPWGQLEAEFF